MKKVLRLFSKLFHKEAIRVFRIYWKLSTAHEKRFDIVLSVAITCLVLFFIRLANLSYDNITNLFETLFGTILTILSVLAGFNVASVSILSSSQSPIITKMKEASIEGKNWNELTQFICYFSWAIVLQLTLLLYSIVLLFFTKILTSAYIYIFLIVVSLWLWGVIYSVFLSIRNAANMFLFFLADN
ncbi:hypothetical protein [Dehalobacter sp. TBBPA1]|uniref:hypothetical protein n=1 Tax=Dehalobacter sp. TBBPA1 TaxID=3235037 RepID=UPI0034A1FF31